MKVNSFLSLKTKIKKTWRQISERAGPVNKTVNIFIFFSNKFIATSFLKGRQRKKVHAHECTNSTVIR